jgi:hypothetical protein
MRRSIPLATLLVLCCSVGAGAQSCTQNAAVKYLRADLALRQSYPLPPDAALTLEKALQAPLDSDDEKLVAAAGEAFAELRHGSVLKNCDWAVSAEDGPLANTAHRGAVREIAALSGIRARIRFRDLDAQGAVNDLFAGIAASRHLSLDGSIASVLIAYNLENTLAEILAQNLNLLPPSQLQELTMELDALPSGSTLGKAVEDEKVIRNGGLLVISDGAKSRDQLIERLLKMAPYLGFNRELVSEIIDGCGGSVSGFVKCVEQQESFCASWAARFPLPPEQFEKRYKSELEPLSKTNPVIRVMTPNLPRLRWTEAYNQTRRALLRAAIAIRMDGPKAVDQHPDPYDGKPFSYKSAERGFRLESHLKREQEPLSLSVADGR